MRWLTLALIALLALLQYPLWLGKGGWLRVWDYDRQLAEQREANRRLEARNAGLDAEVRDLKQGYEAIEERARFDLGMIRQDEVFVQVPERPAASPQRPAGELSGSASGGSGSGNSASARPAAGSREKPPTPATAAPAR